MTDLESRLNAALGADAPPARDALFRLEVLVRRERERFRHQVMRALIVVLASAIVVGLNARAILGWAGGDPGRLAVVAVLATAAVIALTGAPLATLPGVRALRQSVENWFSA